MNDEPTYMVVVRTKNLINPVEGSTVSNCSRCGFTVWVSPGMPPEAVPLCKSCLPLVLAGESPVVEMTEAQRQMFILQGYSQGQLDWLRSLGQRAIDGILQ